MASSSSTAWMPAPGRYPVNVGSSLNRALKARKLKGSPAATTTKRSNLPERDFYSIRYNFKPTSVDTTRPASIEIKKGPDNVAVTAEYPSTQPGEAHVYMGVENPATEVDCVLIYDEEAGTYTLEKMDSFLAIRFDRKTAMANSPRPVSPSPPLASSSKKAPSKLPSASKTSSSKPKSDADGLTRQLLGEDDERVGGSRQAVSHSMKHLRQEEEEEEDELPRPSPPPKRQASGPQATRPVKPLPKARVSDAQPISSGSVRVQHPAPPNQIAPSKPKPPAPALAPPAAPAAPAPAPPKARPLNNKDKGKRPKRDEDIAPPPIPPVDSEDEIVLEFGKPAKRPHPSTPTILPPPTPPSVGLSLPGGSGTFSLPPPAPVPTSKGLGSSSRAEPQSLAPPSPSHMIADESDEEEEEWEQVPTANANPGSNLSTVSVSTPQHFHIELEEEDGNDYHNPVNTYNDIDPEDNIFGSGDEGQEIDANELELEKELNAEMEMEEMEEEDFLTQAMEPISLNQFAGGSGGPMSDDEFSSSEESEDD